VKLPDGSILVSSWAASSVFRGSPGGSFEPIIQNVKSPADIGYDSKRHRVLIPIFLGDSIEAHDLPGAATMAAADPLAPPPKPAPAPKPAAATAPKAPAPAPKPAAATAPKAPAAAPKAPATATQSGAAPVPTPTPATPTTPAETPKK
jgi:hypothetical protein